MTLVVLCAGGHASVVIEALLSTGTRPDFATDQSPSLVGKLIQGIPIKGPDAAVLEMPVETTELVNAMGNRATRSDSGLSRRRDLFCRFDKLGFRFPVIAHRSAIVASTVQPGDGCQVMAGAVIQPRAQIGRNVLINTRAVVEHDCHVGDHSHIAPGAVLCGGVLVGESVHVGAGAIVLGGVRLGAGSVVAAGTTVTRDIEGGCFSGRQDGIV